MLDRADPRLGFQMRVAANSLAILEREARLAPAADRREHERLKKLLGRDGTCEQEQTRACPSVACRRTRRGKRDTALMAHLEASIADKIAIANPKW